MKVLVALSLLLGLSVVGTSPSGAATTPCSIFTVNYTGGSISQIDGATNTVSQTLLVGGQYGIAVAPSGDLYVPNAGSTVWSIDALTDVATPISVGNGANGAAVTGAGAVYVADTGLDAVLVIDGVVGSPTYNTVVTTIPVGSDPYFVGIAPGGGIYVPNLLDDTVSVIDGVPTSPTYNTVVATIPVGDGPQGVAVSPAGMVYVTNIGSVAEAGTTVSVIDGVPGSPTYNTVVATITGFNSPFGVAVAASGAVYVTNIGAASLSVIDPATNTITSTVSLTGIPYAIAAAPSGALYVTNLTGASVWVIDGSTNAVTTTVTVGTGPTAIAVRGCLPQPEPAVSVVVSGDGRTIDVNGSNFPSSSVVTISIDRVVVGTVTTGADGAFSIMLGNVDCGVASGVLTATSGAESASTPVTLTSCGPVAVPVFAG